MPQTPGGVVGLDGMAAANRWRLPLVCAAGGGEEDLREVIEEVVEEVAQEGAKEGAEQGAKEGAREGANEGAKDAATVGATAGAAAASQVGENEGEEGSGGDVDGVDDDDNGNDGGSSETGNGEGGGDGDGGTGGDGKDDGEGEERSTGEELMSVLPDEQRVAVERAAADENISRLTKLTSILNGVFSRTLSTVLATIPVPVLVSIIGVFTTYMGHRFQRYQSAESAKRKAAEAAREARAKQEAEMAEFYQEFTGPLLRATAKLQERLYCLASIKNNALATGTAVSEPHPLAVNSGCLSPTDEARDAVHTAYLLARYFGVLERLKGGSQTLDFGRPAADRIFLNLVGRVQGVLSASDGALAKLQRSELDFSSSAGQQPLPAGPLRVVTHHQSVVGELMIRSHWYGEAGKGGGGKTGGGDAANARAPTLISYRDFCRLLDTEPEMQRWMRPLIAETWRLIHNVDPPPSTAPRRPSPVTSLFFHRSPPPERPRPEDLPITDVALRRTLTASASRSSGRPVELARIFFLHDALVDLVDFLDPPPACRFIPSYRRKRLRLAGAPTPAQTRMPDSLLDLYQELAEVHSGHIPKRLDSQRRAGSKTVELYVKAPVWRAPSTEASSPGGQTAGAVGAGASKGLSAAMASHPSAAPSVDKGTLGDCPFSQRVVMALEEMNVPYKLHKVNTLVKPPWYRILTSEGKVPLLYHEGRLIDDSPQIVTYLHQRFPKARAVHRQAQLPLLVSEGQLTAFGGVFREWLAGAPTVGAPEVEAQLRVVEGVLAQNAELRKGPFLGGRRFCWEDLALVPQLHHVEVAGEAFRGWTIPESLPHTRAYLAEAKKMRSFVKSAPSNASIYAGYGRLVADGPEVGTELPDIID